MERHNISLEFRYTKIAEKFFREHENVREEYKGAIKDLLTGEHPEKVDVKRINGKKNEYFRIKLGRWRIIYSVINGKIVVINAILAGPRGDVYKKMGGLK